jgi:hypothetical protein
MMLSHVRLSAFGLDLVLIASPYTFMEAGLTSRNTLDIFNSASL